LLILVELLTISV